MEALPFGELVKQLRFDRQIGIREFCQKSGLPGSWWSKVERSLALPPRHPNFMPLVCRVLKISPNDHEAGLLLEAVDKAKLREPYTDAEMAGKLPIIFGNDRGVPITEVQIDQLLTLLTEAHSLETETPVEVVATLDQDKFVHVGGDTKPKPIDLSTFLKGKLPKGTIVDFDAAVVTPDESLRPATQEDLEAVQHELAAAEDPMVTPVIHSEFQEEPHAEEA
jgi:transcriptional regulator with XRE-family HTH domain